MKEDSQSQTKQKLLMAALPHVAFDGWSDVTFFAACEEVGINQNKGLLFFPRGGIDLAIYFHICGDKEMVLQLKKTDLTELRYRDKVAKAIKLRFQVIEDKEAVRRSSSLFSLPQNVLEGVRLTWSTADSIWRALGDHSDDINWYTKRTSLGLVYASCLLYWIGDDSVDHCKTWEFVDRRIENVMHFEKIKAQTKENKLFQRVFEFPIRLLGQVKAPKETSYGRDKSFRMK